MQKYYTHLDDFEDDSRSRLLDMVEWLIPRFIAAVSILIIFGVCAHLETL